MRIQLTENYFIEQVSGCPFSWDLYRTYTGERKGENVVVEKPVAYGFQIEHLLKKIADYELSESDKTINFNEYLRMYKEISGNVLKELKNHLKN